jgi:hypothetical protein
MKDYQEEDKLKKVRFLSFGKILKNILRILG